MSQPANSQNKNHSKPPVHIAVSGNGPALVLLHGWGLHGGIWQTILPELETFFTVYNVDMPGFGHSATLLDQLHEQSDIQYDLDFLTETINSALPQRFYLVGWSLGGVVATSIASRYSERVEKLITVASSPCFIASERWPQAISRQVLNNFIDYLSKDLRGTLIKFLSIQTMGSPTQKKDIAQLKQSVFEIGMPSELALKGGLQILNQVDLLDQLAKLTMPLLRIYGRLDTLVPVKSATQVSQFAPNSKSVILKKSGHAPFLSQTDLFLHEVLDFLQRD